MDHTDVMERMWESFIDRVLKPAKPDLDDAVLNSYRISFFSGAFALALNLQGPLADEALRSVIEFHRAMVEAAWNDAIKESVQ